MLTFVEVMRKLYTDIAKVGGSLILGGAILYWMYREVNWENMVHTMRHEMNWGWMLLSFPFGILAQMFRALRWQQALEPVTRKPRTATAMYAVFISYAASLVIPRIGEIARCGILKRYDGVPFTKAVGTVVTERAVDTLLVALIAGITMLSQVSAFSTFFDTTGTDLETLLARFSTTGYWVTALCAVAGSILIGYLIRQVTIYNKVKEKFKDLMSGIASVRAVKSPWLYAIYSIAIWLCYFLHYYLTFFCFPATSHLGMACACVTFVVGTIAVIVPTPNGAGPWHFAVKTMLLLYGVAATSALVFVLVVHTVQTLLVAVLGIYGWTALAFVRPLQSFENQQAEKPHISSSYQP